MSSEYGTELCAVPVTCCHGVVQLLSSHAEREFQVLDLNGLSIKAGTISAIMPICCTKCEVKATTTIQQPTSGLTIPPNLHKNTTGMSAHKTFCGV